METAYEVGENSPQNSPQVILRDLRKACGMVKQDWDQ